MVAIKSLCMLACLINIITCNPSEVTKTKHPPPRQFITTTYPTFPTTRMDPGSELQTTNFRYGHYTYNPKKGPHNTTVPAFCTTEYFQPPPMEFGPTKTQYVRTTTRMRLLACGGCSLTVLNPFPDDTGLPFTTTVSTMATRTIHRAVCSSEPTKPVGSSPPIMCPTDEEIPGCTTTASISDMREPSAGTRPHPSTATTVETRIIRSFPSA